MRDHSRVGHLSFIRPDLPRSPPMPRTARHPTHPPATGGGAPRAPRSGQVLPGDPIVKGTRGASGSASAASSPSREHAAPSRLKRSARSSSSSSAVGSSKTSAQTAHPLASEETSVMSKSKSSAAAVAGHERSRGSAALHPMGGASSDGPKASSRGGVHAKQQPEAAEAPQDDDFDGETPAIGAGTPAAEVELIEEEFDLEVPPVDGATERDVSAVAAPAPVRQGDRGGRRRLDARALLPRDGDAPGDGPRRGAPDGDRGRARRGRPLGRDPQPHPRPPTHALDSLEKDLPTGEDALDASADRRAAQAAAGRSRSSATSSRATRRRSTASVCASLAKAIRLADSDRLWIAHAEEAARRLGEEPGEEEQEAALDQLARAGRR